MFARSHRLLLALALFLLVWGAKLLVIDRFGTDLPFWDQWAKEGSLVYAPWFEQRELWANLVKPHNEHRIAPTLAVNLALVLATGQWDARVQCAVSGAVHAALLAGLFAWALGRFPRGGALAVGGLLALLGALPIAWENLVSGFQSQFYFLAGFSLLAIGGLLGARVGSWRWWGGLACGALALISMGSGLLCAAPVAALALGRLARGEAPRRDAIATLGAAIALGLLGLALHTPTPWHEGLHARTPGAFALYVLRCLSWPWPWQAWLGLALWAPWVAWVFASLRKANAAVIRNDCVLAGGLWVLAQIAAVAYARAGTGEMPASRYGDIFSLGVAFNAGAFAFLAPRFRAGRWLAAGWAALVVVLLTLAAQRSWQGPLQEKRHEHAAYERSVNAFVRTDDYAAFEKSPLPFPLADWLARILRDPVIRPILPASVRAPLAIEGFASAELPGVPPLAGRRVRGVLEPGEWRSALLPAGRGWWKIETAGHIGAPGVTLELITRDGRVLATIRPPKLPGNSWRTAHVRAPREPAMLVARNASAGRWLAFSEPVEISTLGYRTAQLARHGGWVMLAGGLLGLIGLAGSGAGRSRAWFKSARTTFAGRVAGALLLSVGLGLAFTPGIRPGTTAFFFELKLRANAYTGAQVYYDRGAGLSEQQSVRIDVERTAVPRLVRFPLPAGDYQGLRFDPTDFPGHVTLAAARIVNAQGELRRAIAPDEFRPARHIARLEPTADRLEIITTPDADDPQLALSFTPPLSLAPEAGEIARAAAPRALACFLAIVALWSASVQRARLARWLLPADPAPLRRAPALLLLGALFFAIGGVKLAVIARFGSDVPYWDQWVRESVMLFVPFLERGEIWSQVFDGHNEHRIAPTLLLNLGLVVGGGQWDARVQCVANAAVHALVALGLLAWLARRFSRGWTLLGALMLAAIFAPPIASENVLAGFQSQFYFLIGFSLLAIGGLLARPLSAWWWIGFTAALLAIVSMGSGFLCVVPVIAVTMLRAWRGERGRPLLAAVLASAVVIGIGLWQRPSAPWHADMHAHGIGEFLAYATRCLAWPLRKEPWVAPLLWAPWLVLFWRALRARSAQRALPPEADFVLAGGAWVLLQTAAVAYARGGGSTLPPTRYGDVSAVGLVFSFLALVLLARGSGSRARNPLVGAWVLGAAACLAVATLEVWRTDLQIKKRENTAMEHNLSAFVLTGDLTRLAEEPRAFPAPEDLAHVLREPTVRARLPVSIAPPIDLPEVAGRAEDPLPPLVHRDIRVVDRAGEWRSAALPAAPGGWWKIETAGHLGEPGTRLQLVAAADGRVLGVIAPTKPAAGSWRAAYVPAPREPAVLVARLDDPQRWFAFSEPIALSTASHAAWRLAKYGDRIAALGLGLGVALWLVRPRRIAREK